MNSVTLVGLVAAPLGDIGFLLSVDGADVPVATPRPPTLGDRVAVEGSLRSRAGSLYVEAQELDVLPRHMV